MNAHIDLAALARDAEGLDTLCGGDERLFHDMILGETQIDRIVLRIHEQVARDDEMLVGIAERQRVLAERKKRIEARRDGGKALIGKALRIARLPKLELPEVTYSVRDGKARLEVVHPLAVPEEFCAVKWVPDKAKINDAFAEADSIPNWLTREPAKDIVTGRAR
jgi:Siphovirus Gp157